MDVRTNFKIALLESPDGEPIALPAGEVTRLTGVLVLPANLAAAPAPHITLAIASGATEGAIALQVFSKTIDLGAGVYEPGAMVADAVQDLSVGTEHKLITAQFTGGDLAGIASGKALRIEIVRYGGQGRSKREAPAVLLAAFLSVLVVDEAGAGGGVLSIAKAGSTPLVGIVGLSPGANITLTQNDALKLIQIAASFPAPAASAVSVTPFGTIAATNVQDALEEIIDEAAGPSEPLGAVAFHEADTSVHGIPDTALLETLAGAAAKVAAHSGLPDPHGGYHTDARALTWLGGRSSSDLPEGTRLYYTDGRADARAALLIVAHALLADPHGAYHNDARALIWLATRSTTDLAEGTKLFYTDGRADARAAAAVATHAALADPHSVVALLAGRSGFTTWADIVHRIAGQNRFRFMNSMSALTKSADQTALAVNVWTTMAWGQEDFDTDTLHDNSTNNSRILARIAGKYLCAGSPDIDVTGIVGPTMCGTRFIKNGGVTVSYGEMLISIASGPDAMPCTSTIINLAAGDFVELQTAVFGTSGTYAVKQGGANLFSRAAVAYLGE